MNAALASLILASPCGFVTETDLPAIIEADRLCWLLVRCGGCRFSCPAQDLTRLMDYVSKGEDYVRDVSFPAHTIEEAWAFITANHPLPERAKPRLQAAVAKLKTSAALRARDFQEGRNWICTNNFDGSTCGTDAEGNL